MSKKSKKASVVGTINTAIDTTKETAKKANDYALKTTETTVLESISVVSQWQEVGNKALEGGLKLLNNQQDLVFDTLDMVKDHVTESKKRFTKLFA